jgi:hypothetical protein
MMKKDQTVYSYSPMRWGVEEAPEERLAKYKVVSVGPLRITIRTYGGNGHYTHDHAAHAFQESPRAAVVTYILRAEGKIESLRKEIADLEERIKVAEEDLKLELYKPNGEEGTNVAQFPVQAK